MTEPVSVDLVTAAELTGVSVDYLRAAYRSGALPIRYAGQKVLIRREDLAAYIDGLPTERSA